MQTEIESLFILEPYKGPASKYTCPACGKKRVFRRYINKITGKQLSDEYGACDRSNNCGYWKRPDADCYTQAKAKMLVPGTKIQPSVLVTKAELSFIDRNIFLASLNAYGANNFFKFLEVSFGTTTALDLVKRYNIGTSRYRSGSTVFWQVDEYDRVRTGKIMVYDPLTGHREKSLPPTWAHSVLKLKGSNYEQCLFGMHLLKEDTYKPVAVVESEKTAILSSVYMPKYIWVATGGKEQFSEKKTKSLRDRKVVLYPDMKAYDRWKPIADKYNYKISDLLEKNASAAELNAGLDIADFLMVRDDAGRAITDGGYPACWDYETG